MDSKFSTGMGLPLSGRNPYLVKTDLRDIGQPGALQKMTASNL